jgi:hypothetical protein
MGIRSETVAVLLAILLGGSPAALALIHAVDGPEQSIQAAIDGAASGDTVLVAPGHYHQRLVLPDRDLTLGSWALTTGDTLFIPQTILDGDSLGTVLQVDTGGRRRVVLDGFTVQRGFSQDPVMAGGIHFSTDSADVVLRRLHLKRNTSTWDRIAMDCVAWRVSAEHLRLSGNHRIVSVGYMFVISGRQRLTLVDVHDEGTVGPVLSTGCRDSMEVRGVWIENNTPSSSSISSALSVYRSGASTVPAQVRDITLRGCERQYGKVLSITGQDAFYHLRNLRIEACRQLGREIRYSSALYIDVGGLDADSIFLVGNRGVLKHSVGGVLAAGTDHRQLNRVRTLIVEDNVQGDSVFIDYSSLNLPNLVLSYVPLSGARFRRNTIVIPENTEAPQFHVWEARLLSIQVGYVDSLVFEDLQFTDNLILDLAENAWISQQGRCLYLGGANLRAVLRGLVFEDNLHPNTPADGGQSWVYGPRSLGSVMRVDSSPLPRSLDLIIEDARFRGNDDGGLHVMRVHGGQDLYVELRNVQMVDMVRQGVDIHADSFVVENLLIDGCAPYRGPPSLGQQMPLRLSALSWGLVRNATVLHSTTPYVVMTGLTPYNQSREPNITFENCLFADNEYDSFIAEVGQIYEPGWDSFRPGIFNHCLLPEAPEHGEGNLIGIDAFWDEALGPPYLDPSSPLVDAGVDDPVWRDREDPANPGFALWPSHGSTRADIGVTGGPWAMAVDPDWVPVMERRQAQRPASPWLGEPWPNPFNPTARIEYGLPQPAAVSLTVHDLLGRRLAVLAEGPRPAGRHGALIDGSGWASGLYFVTLEAAGRVETRKLLLVR